jgi:phosphoglycerate dehydrogenase-like enzyme
MTRTRVYFPGTMWPFIEFARPIIEPVAELIVQPDRILRGDDLTAVLAGVDGAILTAYEPLPREVLQAAAPRLRVLSKYGVGIETIDLEAATELGIPVTNTPGANSLGVAEHTVALMLASLRRVRELDRLVREGRWNDARKLIGGDFEGSTLGLVGYGNVGQLVGRRAAALGMRVLAYDPYQPAERVAATGAEKADDLDSMLAVADVVSLHMVVTAQTRGMFDAARFARMKPGAVFVNTARAALVDQDALIAALRSGHLAAAGIDVPNPEPLGDESPLFEVENLLITPHHAGTTVRTRERTLTQAAENLVLLLDGRLPDVGLVNPEVRERFEALSRARASDRAARA